jgi:hypothetical protein
LACFHLASAVSVSPGRTPMMDFVPGGVIEGVTNWGTGDRTNKINITTYTNDNLKITVDKTFLDCEIEPCLVKYKVVMPQSYATPGTKKAFYNRNKIL